MSRSEYFRKWKAKKLSEDPIGFRAKEKAYRERKKAEDPDGQREYFRKKAAERRSDPIKGPLLKSYRQRWVMKNKNKIAETKRRWRASRTELQREKDRSYSKKRRDSNIERHREMTRDWRRRNPDSSKRYYRENKDKAHESVRRWRASKGEYIKSEQRKRYASDIAYCMKIRLRARMGVAFRRAKAKKSDHFIELIGCTERELLSHLQSQFLEGMTWENRNTWHIDHIRACAKFNLSDPRQQKACFHYTNLQPLWGSDNMSKGSK